MDSTTPISMPSRCMTGLVNVNNDVSLHNALCTAPLYQNKDAVYTSVHMHNPRNADLFEDVCKDHLPSDDIFVAPHHQPINPEDEDDVVPDQHAAFGIQRATQAVREPAWKDLGLAQLMRGRGTAETARERGTGNYGYYAYYYGYNANGIAGSVAAAGAASSSTAAASTTAAASAAAEATTAATNLTGSPPPAPVRTQSTRFRHMPR
ncbi:apc13 domain-containing protein [Ophiostoma piceae UAMH 11346]|uniref:Apc13 domain-containing protein n=1 Tax=Ophiostoma piceae (strain UAMH 11346) TaxID=1262450 RepID=S3BVW0_OPHP1|nr:apc13 domain-containing protein [Ophiostoma piceae UAMH 11346]